MSRDTMRFCNVCNNLLYPRENKKDSTLEYMCKSSPCTYVLKEVKGSCVFRNEIVKDMSTRLETVLSDVNKDPTMDRTKEFVCANCGHKECVMFLAEQTPKATALQLIYVCCNSACGYKWIGQQGAGGAAPA
jgi:DNA-directed RNA polymerase II subunit RPB9